MGEGGRIVLSEAVPDSAASEGAATDDLGGETGSGEGRGCRETGRERGFGLDRGGGEVAACIAIGRRQDFGSTTIGCSTGGGAGDIEIGARVRLAIAMAAFVKKKKVRKQEIKCENKKICHRPD